MQKILYLYRKVDIWVLSSIIFLIRLPPLYILPIKHPLFNSHSIARYLLAILLLFSVWLIYSKKILLNIDKKLGFITLFYFITQSLSVISATNIPEFFTVYKHIVVGILIFYISIIVLNSKEKIDKIINILILTVVINTMYEFFIYFEPETIFFFLKNFTHGQYWDVLFMNFQRKRFFVDIYDGALIPFLLYYLYVSKVMMRKILALLFISVVSFFALVSNFRTQFLMVLFSIFFGSFIYVRKFLVHSVQIVTLIFFLFLGYKIALVYVGYSSIDRLIFPQEEEYFTITRRSYLWQKSTEIGFAYPFLGVGLNNFYDYLPSHQKLNKSSLEWVNNLNQISQTHPHNIFFGTFAETGFLGLISLMILITYFIKSDIKYLKMKATITHFAIVGFWSLFIFALLNPPVTLPYISLFWLLRAIIISSSKFKFSKS